MHRHPVAVHTPVPKPDERQTEMERPDIKAERGARRGGQCGRRERGNDKISADPSYDLALQVISPTTGRISTQYRTVRFHSDARCGRLALPFVAEP